MKYLLTFLLAIGVLGLLIFVLTPHKTAVCANSISCIKDLDTRVEHDVQGIFLGQAVAVPSFDLETPTNRDVLGETTQETDQTEQNQAEKHIYIDLNQQKLYAFEGNTLFLETLVSTGKWGRTPPGNYHIWVKIKFTRMTGGSGNDFYDLPNVPFNMFFYNNKVSKSRGYALHGAYWHNNFGHEMSHGCVNMRPIDAEKLYYWTSPDSLTTTTYASTNDPGTPISICSRIEHQQGKLPVCIE